MPDRLPEHYFRVRENGAAVFRVDTENRQRRIDLIEIASVNIRNGNIKPHGDTVLSEAEVLLIKAWISERVSVLAARDLDDIHRAIDHLNLTTHWVQSKATETQLIAVTDALLLAMHDLRSALVRKKADRLGKAATSD
jgi:EAL domain-containing protein (putative c-di-GMP-specific phosphodiesterase class I)